MNIPADNSFQPVVALTEDEVKRRFVPFLKDFYRNRYEPVHGSVQSSLDNVSEGGIVADGMISFRKSVGSPFVCTYEATSRDKAAEVKFSLNLSYFIWDSVAFGAVCATIAYIAAFKLRFMWLFSLHAAGNIGLILGIGLIGFLLWYFSMNDWKKYRYIFAIEQFKQYAADEQWIAIAEDVFPAPTDPYLNELRNQCIYSGFGLAIVPLAGNVRILTAPSRLGIYGEGRKMVHWVTQAQWYQMMSEGLNEAMKMRPSMPNAWTVVWNKISRALAYYAWNPIKKYAWALLSKPFGQTADAYQRFTSGQHTQKAIFILCLLSISYFFVKMMSYREEEVADIEALQHWKGGKNPEDQPGYVVDGEPVPYGGVAPGVPKQYPQKNTAQVADETPTINLSGDDETEENIPTVTISKPVKPKKQVAAVPDACAQIHGKKGWIIQDNAFSTREFSNNRTKTLRDKGITCQSTPQSCFQAGKSGYVVWLSQVYSTEAAARQAAATLEKRLRQNKLYQNKLLVRKL